MIPASERQNTLSWVQLSLLCAVSLCGLTMLAATVHLAITKPLGITVAGHDFAQDYGAAAAFMSGRQIYDESFNVITRELAKQREAYCYHPPFVGILFLPFLIFEYPTALGINSLLVVFCLGYVVWTALSVSTLPVVRKIVFAALLPFWYPVFDSIMVGNASAYVVALVAFAWIRLRRSQDFLAGMALGLGTTLKLFPALIIVLLAIAKRWRAMMGGLAVCAAVTLVTFVWRGYEDILIFVTDVMPRDVEIYGVAPANASLAGLIHPLLRMGGRSEPAINWPGGAYILTYVVSVGLLAVPLILLFRRRTRPDSEVLFAFGCVVCLLVTPVMWAHTFPLLLLPAAIVWPRLRETSAKILPCLSLGLGFIPWEILMRRYEDATGSMPWQVSLVTRGFVLSALVMYAATVVCLLSADLKKRSLGDLRAGKLLD